MSEPLEELKRLREHLNWTASRTTAERFDAIIAALEQREKAREKIVAEMRSRCNKNPPIHKVGCGCEWADRLEGK